MRGEMLGLDASARCFSLAKARDEQERERGGRDKEGGGQHGGRGNGAACVYL